MSTNFGAVIKRGYCTQHEEYANTCRQCIWLRSEERRVELERVKGQRDQMKSLLREALSELERNPLDHDLHDQSVIKRRWELEQRIDKEVSGE